MTFLPFDECLTLVPVNLDQYGFSPALSVAVSPRGMPRVVWRHGWLCRQPGLVYAALRDDGLPLVTGATRVSLWRRWDAILRVIVAEAGWQSGALGPGADPRSWASAVRGSRFQVWARKSLFSGGRALLDHEAAALAALLRPGLGLSASFHRPANRAGAPRA